MKIIKKNKRAQFDYFLLKRFIAGIVLTGAEVKSIKSGGININESYVRIHSGQLFLWNALISKSVYGEIEPDREKKLLIHKKELVEIQKDLEQKGLTVIPIALGLDHGLIKIEIAVAKGKKRYDKRETVKEREAQRIIRRKYLGKV